MANGSNAVKEAIRFDSQLNSSLRVFFSDMLMASLTNPSTAKFYIKTINWQHRAASKRNKLEMEGVHVPPILIMSITNRCNLMCKGCFNNALRVPTPGELSEEKLRNLVGEARELGISFIVISGGEPLTRPEMLSIVEENPQILFIMFTNGTLLNAANVERLREARNLVPLISLEGNMIETDERRGIGVYRSVMEKLDLLRDKGVFFGVSVTVTSVNFDDVTEQRFVDDLFERGCRLFLFEEYTPVSQGTESLVVTSEQRAKMLEVKEAFKAAYKAVFLTLPGDEENVGGCLAAGRGFIHVNALGDVEPCPFISYSDSSLINMSLRDALSSDLLRIIREQHAMLPETSSGCSLWNKREWLDELTGKKRS